jgi:hypothetical protein
MGRKNKARQGKTKEVMSRGDPVGWDVCHAKESVE